MPPSVWVVTWIITFSREFLSSSLLFRQDPWTSSAIEMSAAKTIQGLQILNYK
jgi:hypothetical protein